LNAPSTIVARIRREGRGVIFKELAAVAILIVELKARAIEAIKGAKEGLA